MTNLHPRELEERNPIILLVIRPIIGRSNREVKKTIKIAHSSNRSVDR